MVIGFALTDIIEIEAHYELTMISGELTHVNYIAKNKPLKLLYKIMMIFMNGNKICVEFLNNYRIVAKREYQTLGK